MSAGTGSRPYRRTGREIACPCGRVVYRPAWQLRLYPEAACSRACAARRTRQHVVTSILDTWSDRMAYLLGLLVTDGCITDSGSVRFVSLDESLAVFVRDALAPSGVVAAERTRAGRTVYRFTLWSIDACARLRELGLTPRKSLTVGWPTVPATYFWPFMLGVIDGDGTVDKVGRIAVASGSRPFTDGLADALTTRGLRPATYVKRRSFAVQLGIPDSRAAAPLLYACGLGLARKRARLLP